MDAKDHFFCIYCPHCYCRACCEVLLLEPSEGCSATLKGRLAQWSATRAPIKSTTIGGLSGPISLWRLQRFRASCFARSVLRFFRGQSGARTQPKCYGDGCANCTTIRPMRPMTAAEFKSEMPLEESKIQVETAESYNNDAAQQLPF